MTEDRDISEAAEALEALGMTAEEARVYLQLLQAGPSKVTQLAPYFEVSRSKLYKLLDTLAEKGFVAKTPERPTVYHPVFPEEAFEIGAQAARRRRERVASVRETWLDPLRTLHRAPEGPEPIDWTKIEGTERIYQTVQRVIDGARASLRVARNHEPSVSPWLPFVQEAWRAARRRVEDGVDARFLLGPPDEVVENVPEWVIDAGNARLVDLPYPVHFVIADEDVVVFWVQPAPAGSMRAPDDVAVHTDALAPVGTHVMLFEHLWENAQAP